jgi:hypothetical protein
VFELKEGVESSGTTDGPSVAEWIEANGGKHAGILDPLSVASASHFLVGPQALSAVYPDRILPAGCSSASAASNRRRRASPGG